MESFPKVISMNSKMIRMCVAMWALGLVGMSIAHGVFGQGPDDLVCGIFARMWGVGGAGFIGLGGLQLLVQDGAAVHITTDE